MPQVNITPSQSPIFKFFSSRSATETYQECPYRRYLNNHYLKTGITPIQKSVPLTTGTAVHTGVGIILRAIKKGLWKEIGDNSRIIKFACDTAIKEYLLSVEGAGFKIGESMDTQYTIDEQSALTKALIICYSIIEAPFIQRNFTVLSVEKDLQLDPGMFPSKNIRYPTRADAILRENSDRRIYVYSLKTTKRWDKRIQSSYRVDLQGITEILGLMDLMQSNNHPIDDIGGVRYCFLLKEDTTETNEGKSVSNSPLIRGYRRSQGGSVEYAHSWYFPNPNTATGKGALGRGWERIDTWSDYEGGLEGWISALANREIQPEAGDPIKESVIHPIPSYRDDIDLNRTRVEVALIEDRIRMGCFLIDASKDIESKKAIIYSYFPRNRRSCFWPTNCDFIPICHEGMSKPLEQGYMRRIPHHSEEKEYFEKEGLL